MTTLCSWQALAHGLAVEVKGQGYDVETADVKDYDPEDSLALEVSPVSLFWGVGEEWGLPLWGKPLNINCNRFRD